jgi:hypothetical protein
MTSAYATHSEHLRVLRMLHVVNVPNGLRLAHLAFCRRLSEVLNVDAVPTLVGHARFGPLASSRGNEFVFGECSHGVDCEA